MEVNLTAKKGWSRSDRYGQVVVKTASTVLRFEMIMRLIYNVVLIITLIIPPF